MPKKGAAKLKQLNKKKNKQRKKAHQKEQQNEKQNKKQQRNLQKELRNREPFYEKQQEEIDVVSTMYELKSILTPSSQTMQLNKDNDGLYSNIFDMEIVPHPGEMEMNHCSVTLRVRSI